MDSSILMAPSRIQGRKRAARKVAIRRPVSFCASFPSNNRITSIKDRTILRKAGSLPVDAMDADEGFGSEDDGSVQSFSHLANVTVSVHDENTPLQNGSQEFIADEVESCDEIDTGISCCAFDMYDSFFFQRPEEPECPRQGGSSSSSSNSSCDEVTTRIECILKEEYEEGKKESPMVEVNDVTQTSIPSQMCLPQTSEWKQYPLLLTATPNSGMKVLGIRRLCEKSYFDFSVNDNLNASLMELPINNGKEAPRQSWVIDFETELFAGTAMFRIRDCNTSAINADSTTAGLSDHDYFQGKNRRYQVVIRGRFKQKVEMASCLSGLLLDKPLATARKAPPRWVLRAAVRVANIFSPRMDADLECQHPRVLSPLCSTAQTIRRHKDNMEELYLDGPHNEPHPDSTSSLACTFKKRSHYDKSINYDQYRKRSFNAIYDDYMESSGPSSSSYFDDSEYTFEFLQHLVDYNELSLDLGRAMGKMKLGAGLSGQPVRVAALSNPKHAQRGLDGSLLTAETCLWSFDLWHASNAQSNL